ncbi:hypothetical protein SRHO_G00306030 [Serrasalmus rhombeus]
MRSRSPRCTVEGSMRFSCHGEEEDGKRTRQYANNITLRRIFIGSPGGAANKCICAASNTEDNVISQRDAPQLNEMAVLRLDDFSQKSSVLAELEISQNLVKIPLLVSPNSYTKCFWSLLVKDFLFSALTLVDPYTATLADDNVLDGTFARPAPPSPPQSAQRKFGGTKKVSSAKRIPDYLAHPERWTCYSLDDVPETSDKQNSQVAHEFIRGLQERRRSLEATEEPFTPAFNQDHSSSSEHKIIFTKPSQASKDEGKTANKVERAKKSEVGLGHLDAGQEDEEGGKVASLHHNTKFVEEEKRKRKRAPEDEGEQGKARNVAFNSGKKVNRKNFRKVVEEEDED